MTDPRGDDPYFAQRLLRALPGVVFVIDVFGSILYASENAAELVEQSPETLAGSSVLDFVDAEAAWSYASAVAMATDYPDTYMGPMRVKFTSPSGRQHTVDLWATNQLDDPRINGIVCLITEETAAMGMSEAIGALANGQPLATVAGLVAGAMRGHPVQADAVVIEAMDDRFRAIGESSVPVVITELIEHWVDEEGAEPWRAAIASGNRVLHGHLTRSPEALRLAAAEAGYAAVWVEPISTRRGASPGVLTVWRERTGDPSPNTLNSIHRAAGLLALAFRLANEG